MHNSVHCGRTDHGTVASNIAIAVLEKLTIPIKQMVKAASLTAASPPNIHPTTPHTYARTIPPKHTEAITRGDMLEHCFLVGGKDDKNLTDLSEKELVAKANTTLDIMESAALGSPKGIKFIRVDILHSGMITYHLNTLKVAKWIQKDKNAKAFICSSLWRCINCETHAHTCPGGIHPSHLQPRFTVGC